MFYHLSINAQSSTKFPVWRDSYRRMDRNSSKSIIEIRSWTIFGSSLYYAHANQRFLLPFISVALSNWNTKTPESQILATHQLKRPKTHKKWWKTSFGWWTAGLVVHQANPAIHVQNRVKNTAKTNYWGANPAIHLPKLAIHHPFPKNSPKLIKIKPKHIINIKPNQNQVPRCTGT